MLVMSGVTGIAVGLEHVTLTGRPEIYSDSSSTRGTTMRSGVERTKYMSARHLWSQETLGKGLFGLSVIETSMKHGRHVPATLERHNEENVVGIDATMLSREAWDG